MKSSPSLMMMMMKMMMMVIMMMIMMTITMRMKITMRIAVPLLPVNFRIIKIANDTKRLCFAKTSMQFH